MEDSCEHGNDPSRSVRCGELLVQLRKYIKSSLRTHPWNCLIKSHSVVNHLLFVLDKKMEENSTHI